MFEPRIGQIVVDVTQIEEYIKKIGKYPQFEHYVTEPKLRELIEVKENSKDPRVPKVLEKKFKKVQQFIYKKEALDKEEESKNVFKYCRPLIHEFQRKTSDVNVTNLNFDEEIFDSRESTF